MQSTYTPDPSAHPNVHHRTTAGLQFVAIRCALKATVCRWSIERRKRYSLGPTERYHVDQEYKAFVARAKELPTCFLWMLPWERFESITDAGFGRLSAAYDAAAKATLQVTGLLSEGATGCEPFREALAALQSAGIQIANEVARIPGTKPDWDADRIYEWVRAAARQGHGTTGSTGMPGSASGSEVSNTTLPGAGLPSTSNGLGGAAGARKRVFIPSSHPSPASTRRSLPPAARPRVAVAPTLDGAGSFSESVMLLRRVLYDRSVLFVGGEPKPEALAVLKEAFGLREIVRQEVGDRVEVERMQQQLAQQLARSDISLVVFSASTSPQLAREVEAACQRYGKTFVPVHAEIDPDLIAARVLG